MPGWHSLGRSAKNLRRPAAPVQALDHNWQLIAAWEGAAVRQPALFVAGTRDPVIVSPLVILSPLARTNELTSQEAVAVSLITGAMGEQ